MNKLYTVLSDVAISCLAEGLVYTVTVKLPGGLVEMLHVEKYFLEGIQQITCKIRCDTKPDECKNEVVIERYCTMTSWYNTYTMSILIVQ